MRNGCYNTLLSTIRNSHEPDVQTRALLSLRFLISSPAQDATLTTQTLDTLIYFLTSRNAASALRSHISDTDWKTRPPAEQYAICILDYMLHFRLADALQRGLVTNWLSGYPFAGIDPERNSLNGIKVPMNEMEAEKRRSVVQKLAGLQLDDIFLSSIVNRLVYDPNGRKQLRAAGLIGSAMEEMGGQNFRASMGIRTALVDMAYAGEVGQGSGPEVMYDHGGILTFTSDEYVDAHGQTNPGGAIVHSGGGTTGGVTTLGESGQRLRERREESEEEAALRRRRRQAMVISEGGWPLSRDNIFGGVAET